VFKIMSLLKCIVEDCGNRSRSQGVSKVKKNTSAFCMKHYARLRNHGNIQHTKYNYNFGTGHTPEQRFWSRIAITSNPEKCWLWQGHTLKRGYGQVRFKNQMWLTHRLAWFLTHGTINDELFVRHFVCDNPPCCNPNHLLEGTHEDNMNDRKLSGRNKLCGARNGKGNLTA
jgi:hypothetical protein